VLGIAASAVVVLGVYLFVEVRADPAAPPPPAAIDKPRAAALPPGDAANPTAPPPRWHGRGGLPRPEVHEVVHVHGSDAPAEPAVVQSPDDMMRANPRLDDIMREANKAFDAGDYARAIEIAQKVLAKSPGNVRMLRVIVSSACLDGDDKTAQQYYSQLAPNSKDRADMRTRCGDKMGMTFTE